MAKDELLFEGVVEHHGNFAFLISDDPGRPDLFLKGPTLRLAMDGDRAVARRVSTEGDKSLGEILRVTKRSKTTITGMLRRTNLKSGLDWIAIPEEGDERDAIAISSWPRELEPKPGDIVVVKVDKYPTFKTPASGRVQEILGRPRDPRVRLTAVLRSRGIFEEFPQDVLAEAQALPEIRPEDLEGRLDLRGEQTFTIDGADAKDFDDAVSLDVLPGGTMRLGVHIAHVSHYVRPGTALDREAQARGTSVYVADRVVPMLPTRLSEQLCSLRPNEDKLTLSCMLYLDQNGEVGRYEIKPSVIRSAHRLIYEDVESMNVPKDVEETLLRMKTLARALTSKRIARGGLDVDMPEYKVTVDAEGKPTGVIKRPRLGAHRLIEEFMLLANEAVAQDLERRKLPFLRRVHDDPDPKRLETLGAELRRMGAIVPMDLAQNPTAGLQTIMRRAVGHPLQDIINMVCVRSLKQAKYSEQPGGHFGLASKEYCHFTSPIRRYPDLQVHRACAGYRTEDMKELAEKCSERERSATDAERKSTDILRAELLRDSVGEIFDGVVTGKSTFGVFVTFTGTGASALSRGAQAALGARVRVKLDAVDEGKGQLEVTILKPRDERPPSSPSPAVAPGEAIPPTPRPEFPRQPDRSEKFERKPRRPEGAPDKKPWEKRPRPEGDRPRFEKKPWEKREPSSDAPGEKKPWEKKPWEKREGAPGEKKPWEKKPWEKRGPSSGAPGEKKPWEKKPWEKREGAPGEKKPWEKRGPSSGAPGDKKPWEKKPWEKREGAPGDKKPWEKKPWEKRGPSSGAPGDKKPWEKKPWEKREPSSGAPGERRPWKDRPAPGGAPSGEKKPWEKKPWEKRSGAPGEKKPWEKRSYPSSGPGKKSKPWEKRKGPPKNPRKPFNGPGR